MTRAETVSAARSKAARDAIVLVGPLPPPFTGQALAFEVLVQGLMDRNMLIHVIDLSHQGRGRMGFSRLRRTIDYVHIFSRLVRALAARRLAGLYITLSSSRQGMMRDAVIVALARLHRLRVVGHFQTGNYDAFYASQPAPIRWLARRVLYRAERLIILSERLRDMFAFAPDLDEKVRIVHNAAPVRIPSAEVVGRKEPPAARGPIRLLFLSNLIRSKGYLDALEATRLLRQDFGLSAELSLAGEFLLDPGDPADYDNLASAQETFWRITTVKGLAGSVDYKGVVTAEDKLALLRDAHFFLLPSYYSIEGQPLSIAEALAWGVVPITTAYRAIPDLVVDGVTGIHVPPRDPQAIAQAIAHLTQEPAQYRRMSVEGRSHYEAGFSIESHVEAMAGVLHAAFWGTDHYRHVSGDGDYFGALG